jgi:hypothetical protein
VIGFVLVQADIGKPFAIEQQRPIGERIGADQLLQAGMQRRTDAPGQFVLGGTA